MILTNKLSTNYTSLSFSLFFIGTSDPYCEVSMGSQEHRTKVIPKDLNPKWNSTVSALIQTFLFVNWITNLSHTLKLVTIHSIYPILKTI